MIARRAGSIVTVSSAVFDTPIGYPYHAVSKAGVPVLAQATAKELAPHARGPAQRRGARTSRHADGRPYPRCDVGVAVRPGAIRYATADQIAHLASPSASNVVVAVPLSNGRRFTV